jgi:hypothetical protein
VKDSLNPNKLTQVEIEAMRKKRTIERRAKNALKEIILYATFIWVQFIVAYSKTDPNSYNYRARLIDVFLTKDNFYSSVRFNFFRPI